MTMSLGGGFADAGPVGEYFANTTLDGTPAFVRKDVRVDFDWGTAARPGGSIGPGYRDVGPGNFSARWTGRVVARFAETYTFKTTSAGGVRLSIRPAGTTTWTTLVDHWDAHTAADDVGTYAMTAGATYDIKLEYYGTTGAAVIKLAWSSPSTPEETIDAVAQVGLNFFDWNAAYADIVKGARNSWWRADGGVDASGWPNGDCQYVFQESMNLGSGLDPLMRGTITFSFKGKADVDLAGNVVFDQAHTYDADTNTTTGTFTTLDRGINASFFKLTNATRDGNSFDGTNGGITDLKMMRPTAPDATASYATDATFTPQVRDALGHFTLVRFQAIGSQERDWSDRTLPTFFNQAGGDQTAAHYNYPGTDQPIGGWESNPTGLDDNGASWEYKVMLCNEAGRDLMIGIPPPASGRTAADVDSYVYKLAQLIRYGSDGVNPYTSPQADPAYPPLNPNLRVYFEIGNELWNGAAAYFTDYSNVNALLTAVADAYVQGHTEDPGYADFQAINYDNYSTAKSDGKTYDNLFTWRNRSIILRVMQMSDVFRGVFGDAAMTYRVRPLYEWQYNNLNGTASTALSFVDRYFNNGDGVQHVTTPHPVSYYLWGGGGATYYGAVNPYGLTDLISPVSVAGFEVPTVVAGYNQAPAGSGWTFSGTAGIARDAGMGDGIPPSYDGGQVGYITDVGSMSIDVTFPTAPTSNIYSVVFKAVNRTRDYAYDGSDLQLMSWGDGSGVPTSGTNLVVVGIDNDGRLHIRVFDAAGSRIADADERNFPYQAAAIATLKSQLPGLMPPHVPTDAERVQVIEEATSIAVRLPVDQENLRVYLDDTVDITARAVSQADGCTPMGVDYAGSEWLARNVFWAVSQYYYTKAFSPAPGSTHRITIRGRGDINNTSNVDQTAFLEDVRIASIDRIFADGMPGGGEAAGQPPGQNYQAVMNAESSWARAFGLEMLSYEGGWSLGGDDAGSTVQLGAKYGDARTVDVQTRSLDMFYQAGASVSVLGTYAQWPSWADYYAEQGLIDVAAYPIVQGVDASLSRLPAEARNGTRLPAILNLYQVSVSDGAATSGMIGVAGGWMSWNVLAPRVGVYTLKLTTSGTGGNVVLLVDDRVTVASGTTGGDLSGTVTLTPGLHTVKVRGTSGTIVQVAVIRGLDAPASPVLNAVAVGAGSASLSWAAVAGATGYNVRYGTSRGTYDGAIEGVTATGTTVTGLTNDRRYYFAVTAYNADGEGLPSDVRDAYLTTTPRGTSVSIWWPNEVPISPVAADPGAVEMGVKFTPSVAGQVVAIRFYKGVTNTGTHVGHLWAADGTLLATATFADETATGWQSADLDTPVVVEAGTTYVASYHAPNGNYACDYDYFVTAFGSEPLVVPANGSVYAYGPAGSFPTGSYRFSNYWVDVIFRTRSSGFLRPALNRSRRWPSLLIPY